MNAVIIIGVVYGYLTIMNNTVFRVAALADLSTLKITGADAADFLHGQLTQDITGLPPGQARLAGYCTPKGRLLGTLVIWRNPAQTDEFLALVKTDIAEALVKRLSMFVLRAKVKITLEACTVLGVTSEVGARHTPEQPLSPPDSAAPWTVVETSQGIWVSAPRAQTDIQRWWLVASADQTPKITMSEDAHAAWQAADIAAGLPWIEAATQDVFIPQTLNLDLIDGVHFTKGCYPGQEVVARSHYRGTIKRRMAYGVTDTSNIETPKGGTDIFDALRPGSPAGRVVNAATHNGQAHMLLEVQLADLGAAEYRLDSAEGTPISIQPLPYQIDTAETP